MSDEDDEDYFDDDDEEPMQTFLYPIGSVLKRGYENEKFTVVGYVTYNGDTFHILLDKFQQEFDQWIEENDHWKAIGVV